MMFNHFDDVEFEHKQRYYITAQSAPEQEQSYCLLLAAFVCLAEKPNTYFFKFLFQYNKSIN